jgi:hypothetical protein
MITAGRPKTRRSELDYIGEKDPYWEIYESNSKLGESEKILNEEAHVWEI